MDNRSWEPRRNQILAYAFLLASICGILSFVMDIQAVWIRIAIVILVFFGVCAIYWPQQSVESRVFYVPVQDARQIISRVLEKSPNFPYESREIFEINGTTAKVNVKFKSRSKYSSSGTVISIGPITDQNALIIRGLQQKIEEAFRPRGLS